LNDSTFTWATVTDVSPFRIRLDGDTAELPLTPDSLVDPAALAVDDRVRCEISTKRVVVLGVAGGLVALSALLAPVVADLDALPAAAGFSEGRRLHVDALGVDFEQVDGVWVQQGVATVASTSARDTEYAKAAAAYRIAGVEVLVTGDSTTYRRVGSSWAKWRKPWASYVGTLTNFTVGNGTHSGAYAIVDGEVRGRGKFVFGSTSSVGSNPNLAYPETPHSSILSSDHVVGSGRYRDTSASDAYLLQLSIYPTVFDSILFRRLAQSSTYSAATIGRLEGWNSTQPVTVATGDTATWEYAYPIADSY
jgi:hypothetical protein